jgi:hypothetical protein
MVVLTEPSGHIDFNHLTQLHLKVDVGLDSVTLQACLQCDRTSF